MKYAWRFVCLLFAATVLMVGCSGDDGAGTTGPSVTYETFQIGPAGGTFVSRDGSVTLEVPAAALATDTTITLAAATSFPANGGYVAHTCYAFGPNGLTFDEPITLTIAYDKSDLPSGIHEVTVGLCKVIGTVWQPVAGSTIDTAASTVSAAIGGFSSYGLVGRGGTVFDGNYDIYNTAHLAAFASYTGISGNLTVHISDTLTSLAGLDTLEWIGGDLHFTGSGLTTCDFGDGFSALTTINGGLRLNHAPQRTAVFPALTSVGGKLYIRGWLKTLSCPNLAAVGDSLRLYYADSLIDLSGLGGLASIGNAIYVTCCASLQNLTGLEDVTSVLRGLEVSACKSLTSLEGLDGITVVVGEVEINNCDALTSLLGLNLVQVGGLQVSYCDNITSIEQLIHLAKVGDQSGLVLSELPRLNSLHGLESVGMVTGQLQIWRCRALSSLDGLPEFTTCGAVILFDNDALLDIAELRHLQTLHSGLDITDCDALTNLDSLCHLNDIGGNLTIGYNQLLANLDGLSGLLHIGSGSHGGSLLIDYNPSLSDITGLHNLQPNAGTGFVVPGAIRISHNAMGNTNAWAFVESIGGTSAVRDTVIIDSN